jgi:hypothetical protein
MVHLCLMSSCYCYCGEHSTGICKMQGRRSRTLNTLVLLFYLPTVPEFVFPTTSLGSFDQCYPSAPTNSKPAMTILRSFLARASVLTMVVLRTCHGFYVPGVRPYEFARGEEVPMKVNALTSIHTQVRMRLALCEALTLLSVTLYGLFICLPSHHDCFPCSCALNLIATAKPKQPDPQGLLPSPLLPSHRRT